MSRFLLPRQKYGHTIYWFALPLLTPDDDDDSDTGSEAYTAASIKDGDDVGGSGPGNPSQLPATGAAPSALTGHARSSAGHDNAADFVAPVVQRNRRSSKALEELVNGTSFMTETFEPVSADYVERLGLGPRAGGIGTTTSSTAGGSGGDAAAGGMPPSAQVPAGRLLPSSSRRGSLTGTATGSSSGNSGAALPQLKPRSFHQAASVRQLPGMIAELYQPQTRTMPVFRASLGISRHGSRNASLRRGLGGIVQQGCDAGNLKKRSGNDLASTASGGTTPSAGGPAGNSSRAVASSSTVTPLPVAAPQSAAMKYVVSTGSSDTAYKRSGGSSRRKLRVEPADSDFGHVGRDGSVRRIAPAPANLNSSESRHSTGVSTADSAATGSVQVVPAPGQSVGPLVVPARRLPAVPMSPSAPMGLHVLVGMFLISRCRGDCDF